MAGARAALARPGARHVREPAEVLEARLALVERVRRAELAAVRHELAREAAALLRGRSHDLGNAVQIVRLASLELSRRIEGTVEDDVRELISDLRGAAEQATDVLGQLLAIARPEERTTPGAPVAATIRATIELARVALTLPVTLIADLAEDVCTRATAAELEAIVIAALLDTSNATRIALQVRVRTIEGRPWIELLRIDDRAEVTSFDPAIAAIAAPAAGEVTISEGRTGWELSIELPVAVRTT